MTLVIDMDSHLRDGYFLDKIYDLKGEFASYTPKKLNDPEDIREVQFDHAFNPSSAPHEWIYFKKTNWLGGEIAERQEGGFNMKRRVSDNDEVAMSTSPPASVLPPGPAPAA